MKTWYIIVGGFTLLLILAGFNRGYQATAQAPPHESTDAFMARDWHPTGGGMEVRWIADDASTHVGGHCYVRKIDGSMRNDSGEAVSVPVGEKFCIAANAKDTPFDVPDNDR